MMEKVEMNPAFMWDCPECGRENFARAIVPELSDEERMEMCQDYGIDPWDEGNWMTMPEKVTCHACRKEFEAVHYGDDDSEMEL